MVEADEAYIGGKKQNKHQDKRRSDKYLNITNEGKPYKSKKVIVGLIERNGKVILKYVPRADVKNMVSFIQKHVPKDSTVYTD